ncbi:MAG: hypothetical protein NTV34_01785, partial [Proteobacteria bacterium]|nr:hypothetical protein [Pseudomonadota bacterium]
VNIAASANCECKAVGNLSEYSSSSVLLDLVKTTRIGSSHELPHVVRIHVLSKGHLNLSHSSVKRLTKFT